MVCNGTGTVSVTVNGNASRESPAPAIEILSGTATDAATRLEAEKTASDEPLWYLAYGSNLNSSVFKGRRGINPIEHKVVLVQGLELTFDLPGLPYFEPRFANCRFAETGLVVRGNGYANGNGNGVEMRKRKNEKWELEQLWAGKGALIGVAYLITPKDFAKVLATEGGGSGYKMVAVAAQVIQSKDDSESHDKAERRTNELTGDTVHAFTLLASSEKTRKFPGQPSARYLKLIQNGAEEHVLPLTYRTYLASLKPYSASSFSQKVGRAVSIVLWVPPMVTLALLGIAFKREDGSYPAYMGVLRKILEGAMWGLYEKVMRKVLGDGEGEEGAESTGK